MQYSYYFFTVWSMVLLITYVHVKNYVVQFFSLVRILSKDRGWIDGPLKTDILAVYGLYYKHLW